MKTLIAAVAFAMALAAPAFAQSVHAWGWKGALAAPASAKSAYAAARRGFRARARCPATATSARGARRTGPTATELRSATQRGLLIGADSMGCFVVDAAGFRAGRNFVDSSQAIAAVYRNLATDRTRGHELDQRNPSFHLSEFNCR